MCRVCKQALSVTPKEGLKMIGEAMKSGRDPEHFKESLDKLLGTEEPVVNEEADAAFEKSYRRDR